MVSTVCVVALELSGKYEVMMVMMAIVVSWFNWSSRFELQTTSGPSLVGTSPSEEARGLA